MVRGILSDINIQGHVRILAILLESEAWREIWQSLNLPVRTFRDLGLARNAPDSLVWQVCQDQQLVLITGNRNADGPDSLEETLRARNTPTSLPVFTIANIEQVRHSRDYANRVVEQLLVYLLEIDNYLGTGRLFLP